MSIQVNPNFLGKIKSYGADKINLCFNCGNCTATCPFSYNFDSIIPRKLIRYAVIGAEDFVSAAPEVWLCYECEDCSTLCPRQANPNVIMRAIKKYAIARYLGPLYWFAEKMMTSLSALIGFNVLLTVVFSLLIAIALALGYGVVNLHEVDLAAFIPPEYIHDFGLLLGAYIGIMLINGIYTQWKLMRNYVTQQTKKRNWISAIIGTLVDEIVTQKRHLYCESKHRWVGHFLILWGFLGLGLATFLSFLFNSDFSYYPPIIPDLSEVSTASLREFIESLSLQLISFIGMVSGIALLIGLMIMIYRKVVGLTFENHFSDWYFVGLLAIADISGLLTLAGRVLSLIPWVYYFYVVHLISVAILIVMAPFSRFAHSVYRFFTILLLKRNNYV